MTVRPCTSRLVLCNARNVAPHRSACQSRSAYVRPVASTNSSAPSPQHSALPRRCILQLASTLGASTVITPLGPASARGMDRYVKKKDFDPIETYVPPLLAARDQLLESRPLLDSRDNVESIRSKLRSGVFDGLRDNVRVLGIYAERAGRTDSAALVKNFFSSLQAYDAALFQSIRSSEWEADSLRSKLDDVVKAMDELLATVPQEALARSQSVVEKVKTVDSPATADSDGPLTESSPVESTKNLDLLF